MFQTNEPILYDVPATLHKWQSPEKKRSGESLGSMQIWDGTLAGCVREFMGKPISERSLYDIFTDIKRPSPSHIAVVHELLQRGPYASILGEGYAGLARRRADRAHSLPPSSRRAAPPIYPDLIYDRHRQECDGASRPASWPLIARAARAM